MSTAEIAALQDSVAALSTTLDQTNGNIDDMWILLTGSLVFFMQAGFAMLEAGSVNQKNTLNILFKNICDACISAIFFWLIGYGFAYGETEGGFIGRKGGFALSDDAFTDRNNPDNLDFASFYFQWTFAATAATIVSGSVAERCKLEAYFIYSVVISAFVYPIIVHWAWGEGWLSPFGSDVQDYLFYGRESNNYIDFAGSGVVHMVGGWSGLVGAIILGPRKGRFNADGSVNSMPGHNMTIALLGVIILWFGWYGFNPGSTLCIANGCSKIAGKVAVTTTIAAAFGGMTVIVAQRVMGQKYDLGVVGNGILAGLVGVTAPCAVIEPWGAMIIGMSSAFLYMGASKLLLHLQIDDPLDAVPIHGFCGFWGVLSVGIFGSDQNAAFAGYQGSAAGFHPFRTGEQFGVQIVGACCIFAWTIGTAVFTFLFIKYTVGLRVEDGVEEEGLDHSEHGAKAYHMDTTSPKKSTEMVVATVPAKDDV